MKKIMILIISLFLFTGCSVQYNLVINEDLSLTEEAKLTGTDEFFSNYYKTTKSNVIKYFLDIYKNILEENNYSYEFQEDRIPYILVTKKYNNVNEYINNSKLFNDYFDKIEYTENGNIKKIETIGFNENDPDNPDRFYVRELKISITCPYVVKNNNAVSVDKKTNTYYYELNKDNDYKILIEYDTSSKFNPNADLIKLLLMCLIVVMASWVIIVINKINTKNK